MADSWDRISELARLAPTPHNTQPYRLRPRGDDEAEIVLVPSRLLPVEDRGNRYVYAALGIFAAAVELAARAIGKHAEVRPAAYPGVLTLDAAETVVGHVTLSAGAADDTAARKLLTSRRTSRLRYHPRPVEDEAQAKLVALAEAHGHRLLVESEPAKVEDLLAQNAWAIIDNLQIRDDRREIERWVRYGRTTPAEGDGLWEVPLSQPAWELKLGFWLPWLFLVPGLSHLAVWRFARTMLGTQHIALLCGPFREWNDVIGAGTLLMKLWVEMAAHDVYMHPFGSTLTNPKHAKIIGDKFGDPEGWLIFRFGYSDTPPASPRLPSVVIR